MPRLAIAEGSATALSSSYSVIALSIVPDRVHLGGLFGKIDTIASSAASVTWYLAADSAGDHAITSEVTSTIVTGKTTATDGGFAEAVDIDWAFPSWATGAGSLYLVAKVDTGSANLTPGLTWRGM
jgi:hypothetical protein